MSNEMVRPFNKITYQIIAQQKTALKYLNEETKSPGVRKRTTLKKNDKNLTYYNLNWELATESAKDRDIGKTAIRRCLLLAKTYLIQSKSKNYFVMLIARPSIVLNFIF